MSSNIRVQRICDFCENEFTAKTTVTRYCGDKCAKRAYKARIRLEKIDNSNRETAQLKNKALKELQLKDYLTITEACQLLSVSRWTLWRAIKRGDLKAAKIGRRAIIRRSDIEQLFTANLK